MTPRHPCESLLTGRDVLDLSDLPEPSDDELLDEYDDIGPFAEYSEDEILSAIEAVGPQGIAVIAETLGVSRFQVLFGESY